MESCLYAPADSTAESKNVCLYDSAILWWKGIGIQQLWMQCFIDTLFEVDFYRVTEHEKYLW